MIENMQELITQMLDMLKAALSMVLVLLADFEADATGDALLVALGFTLIILLIAFMVLMLRRGGDGLIQPPAAPSATLSVAPSADLSADPSADLSVAQLVSNTPQPAAQPASNRQSAKMRAKKSAKKPAKNTAETVVLAQPLAAHAAPIESLDPSDQGSNKATQLNAENINLASIESEMLALKELYAGGHISSAVYIEETRALYEQAQKLRE